MDPMSSITGGFAQGQGLRRAFAERGFRNRTEEALARYNAGEINEDQLEQELNAAGSRGFARGLDMSRTREQLRTEALEGRNRVDMRGAARAQLDGNMLDTYGKLGSVAGRMGDVTAARGARGGLDSTIAGLNNRDPDGIINLPAAQRDVARMTSERGDMAGTEGALNDFYAKSQDWFSQNANEALMRDTMGDKDGAMAKLTSALQGLGIPNLYAQWDQQNPNAVNFVRQEEGGQPQFLGQVPDLRTLATFIEQGGSIRDIAKNTMEQFRGQDAAQAAVQEKYLDAELDVFKESIKQFGNNAAPRYGVGGVAAARAQGALVNAGLVPSRTLENGLVEYKTADGEIVFMRVNDPTAADGEGGAAMGGEMFEFFDTRGNPVDPTTLGGRAMAAELQAASADALASADNLANFRAASQILNTQLETIGARVGRGRGAPAGAGGGQDSRLYLDDTGAQTDPVAAIQSQLSRPLTQQEIAQIRTPGATFSIADGTPAPRGPATTAAPATGLTLPTRVPAQPAGDDDLMAAYQTELRSIATREAQVRAALQAIEQNAPRALTPQTARFGIGAARTGENALPPEYQARADRAKQILKDLELQRRALETEISRSRRSGASATIDRTLDGS